MAEGDQGDHGLAPTEIARRVVIAVAGQSVGDVLALISPDVVCQPVARPALTSYFGHEGMIRLAADLRAAYGRYRTEIEDIVPAGSGQITAQIAVISGPDGELRERLDITFTITDGQVTFVDSTPA